MDKLYMQECKITLFFTREFTFPWMILTGWLAWLLFDRTNLCFRSKSWSMKPLVRTRKLIFGIEQLTWLGNISFTPSLMTIVSH